MAGLHGSSVCRHVVVQRLEQRRCSMDDEIAHMGIVDGLLRLRLPGLRRPRHSRDRCRRCRASREILESRSPVSVVQLTAEDEVQTLGLFSAAMSAFVVLVFVFLALSCHSTLALRHYPRKGQWSVTLSDCRQQVFDRWTCHRRAVSRLPHSSRAVRSRRPARRRECRAAGVCGHCRPAACAVEVGRPPPALRQDQVGRGQIPVMRTGLDDASHPAGRRRSSPGDRRARDARHAARSRRGLGPKRLHHVVGGTDAASAGRCPA